MKLVLALALAAFGLAHAAQADDAAPLFAGLTSIQLDPALGIHNNYGAYVEIAADETISLQISTCPPAAMCTHAGPSYDAPIVGKSADGCGVVTYVAKRDLRPVDGALVELEVKDFSKSLCEIPYPFMTEVTLKTGIVSRMTGESITTLSTLKGNDILK